MRYTETSAVEHIRKNGGDVDTNRHLILHQNYGISVWGAVDFLVSKHKYQVVHKL